jgi:hypothetical protein
MKKIDIWDLAYVDTHEEIISPRQKAEYSSNIFRIFYAEIQLVCYTLYYWIRYAFRKKNRQSNCQYFLFAVTGNNRRVLMPLKEKLENARLFSLDDFHKEKVGWYALLYSPFVFLKFIRSSGFSKKTYCSKFLNLCLSYGFYIVAEDILKNNKPEYVIVANDHSYPQRSCFRVAQKLGIKTIYIQHASVSENFPALEYDYAFLDGQESLDKYTANNKKCQATVFLSGNPRFDIIKIVNTDNCKKQDVVKCGVAINELDEVEKIRDLTQILQKNIDNIEFVVRPHPAMCTDFWRTFANKNHCALSDAKTENPFVFISKCNVFISGESSFHLDVTLSGKKSYYYNFTGMDNLDWYGYLKNGLIEDITHYSPQQIKETISNKIRLNIQLLRYYVSNFDTPYWGKSTELIAETISQFSQSTAIPTFWKLNKQQIYELN